MSRPAPHSIFCCSASKATFLKGTGRILRMAPGPCSHSSKKRGLALLSSKIIKVERVPLLILQLLQTSSCQKPADQFGCQQPGLGELTRPLHIWSTAWKLSISKRGGGGFKTKDIYILALSIGAVGRGYCPLYLLVPWSVSHQTNLQYLSLSLSFLTCGFAEETFLSGPQSFLTEEARLCSYQLKEPYRTARLEGFGSKTPKPK